MNRKIMVRIANTLFIITCVFILFFLLRAPEESTAKIPKDSEHIRFHSIKSKKEAEKYCSDCHGSGEDHALPEDHPPSYRCLFCHKRN